MTELLAGLIAVIVEAILKVFTSRVFVKMITAAFVYVFLFAIIPALINFLVPSTIMDALTSYVNMLNGGGTSLTCSGSEPIYSGHTVSCSTAVTLVQFGQGVAYILAWFQVPAGLGYILPALAISFLFRRI